VPSVVVITASTGRAALRRCVESVREQDFPDVRHLVVVDGPRFAASAGEALDGVDRDERLEVLVLPRNTGHSKHYGYRIYGALPLLVDDDIVCFLDEDNWFDPDHLRSAVDALRCTGAEWAYSLRRICTERGEPICEDDSDSLGYWPKLATLLDEDELSRTEMDLHARYPNLVDSSCYILPRPIACAVAPLWQDLHADSVVTSSLVREHAGVCTGRSTLNYALGGGSGTPDDWFTYGNRGIRELYGHGPLPWRQTPIKLGPSSLRHPVRATGPRSAGRALREGPLTLPSGPCVPECAS
jgi:glycosyltransferase involved in cell wall biosynthesis